MIGLLVFPERCYQGYPATVFREHWLYVPTNYIIDINDMKSTNGITVLLVYWPMMQANDTPSSHTKIHTSTKRNEGEGKRGERD